MTNQFYRSMLYILILVLVLSGCSTIKVVSPATPFSGTPSPTRTQAAPTTTPTVPEVVPKWSQVEGALSRSILGTVDGKCEWEVWGWLKQKVYVWALCQAGSGPGSTAVSVPAVVWVRQDQSIQNVEIPGDGTNYAVSIRRLFPPAVQDKVFAHSFDVEAAEKHLKARWDDPTLAPVIYLRAGDPLPREGEEAVPAISAEFVDRIVPVARLGEGSIHGITLLSDGRLAAYSDQGIGLIDVAAMRSVSPFQEQMVGSSGWLSSDGSLLAVWNQRQVQVIQVEDGEVIRKIAIQLPGGKVAGSEIVQGATILAVEVRPPGEEIYSNQVELYSMDDGRLLNTWDMQGRAMLFSPDGQVMASRYVMSGLKLWSIPDGKLLQPIQAVVGGAAFSPDGRWFAASDMGLARVFQVADGKELYHLSADFGPVSGVEFSPDGELLLTWVGDSYPARLWHAADGTQALEIPVQGVTAGAFTSDGTAVALAANGVMGLYSTSTGETIGSLGNHFPAVADIAFAPENAAGEDARLAVLYGVNTEHSLLVNWNIPQGKQQFLSDAYSGISLAYTRDPFGIAVGTWDGTVQMVDAEHGTILRTFEGLSAQVQSLAVNMWYQLAASSMNEVRIFALPDPNERTGKKIAIPGGWVDHLAWSCYLAAASMDGTIRLLDETGEEGVKTLKTADDGYENHLAISQDCQHILVGKNRSIYLWQTPDWLALPIWTTPDTITSLEISPDGSVVAVGLADGNVQLLERKTGALLREFQAHAGVVNALDFAPEGSYLASGGNDGVVIVWGVK